MSTGFALLVWAWVWVFGVVVLTPCVIVLSYMSAEPRSMPMDLVLALAWPVAIFFLWMTAVVIAWNALAQWRWRRMPVEERRRRWNAFFEHIPEEDRPRGWEWHP